jgi:hypothetical protein
MPFDIEDARARLADLDRPDPAALLEQIRGLARPRMTGTEEADAVERELRHRFEAVGYRTTELPFSFSTWPGRFGLSVAGGILGIAGVATAVLLPTGRPTAALLVLVLAMGLALVPLITFDLAIRRLPWGRVATRNLLFQTGTGRPSWIIMAHRDSKSQLVPTLARTMAVAIVLGSWLALVVLAVLWFGGEPFRVPTLAGLLAVLLVLAAVALVLSWTGNDSPGALDNASGLAALLDVAARSAAQGDVAFLVTDAEELGLVGARAVASRLPAVQGVINVDSLDDEGTFYIAEGHGLRRKGFAPQLAAALLTAGAALDLPVERRHLPRSIPVDHQPVAGAGIPALTVVRGAWRSLLRIHRPEDDVEALDGRGAADGAALLTGALRLMREDTAPHLAGQRTGGT